MQDLEHFQDRVLTSIYIGSVMQLRLQWGTISQGSLPDKIHCHSTLIGRT